MRLAMPRCGLHHYASSRHRIEISDLQSQVDYARESGSPYVLVPGRVGEILTRVEDAQLRIDYATRRGQTSVTADTPPGETTLCIYCDRLFYEGQMMWSEGCWTCWECDH